jgi:hypothetical protein
MVTIKKKLNVYYRHHFFKILTRLEAEAGQKRVASNLRVQSSKYASRNAELESELEASQTELDQLRVERETRKSLRPKRLKLETNEPPEKEAATNEYKSDRNLRLFDTFKVVRTVNTLLKAHHISKVLFAREVAGLGESGVSTFLTNPVLWANYTEFKQIAWQKMRQWSQSTEAIQSLEAVKLSREIDLKTSRFLKTSRKFHQILSWILPRWFSKSKRF